MGVHTSVFSLQSSVNQFGELDAHFHITVAQVTGSEMLIHLHFAEQRSTVYVNQSKE